MVVIEFGGKHIVREDESLLHAIPCILYREIRAANLIAVIDETH